MDTEDEFMDDEVLSDPLQGMANNMDNMTVMILEFSHKVQSQDKAAAKQKAVPLTSLSRPQMGRRRARRQYSPTPRTST